METEKGLMRYTSSLMVLLFFALGLGLNLLYLYLSDPSRFPVNTIKVSATYEHITHKELEVVLEKYVNTSFFFLSLGKLKEALLDLEWTDTVDIERIWPDRLHITLHEKVPVAIWNNTMLMENGEVFPLAHIDNDNVLPHLKGNPNQSSEVYHVYKKMSKILSDYGLKASVLEWRKNEAWELTLSDEIMLRLGKRFFLERLERFCKAYSAVFKNRLEKKASVDLRYPRGMAIQWK